MDHPWGPMLDGLYSNTPTRTEHSTGLVVTLAHGHPQYTDLLNRIRGDVDLVARMWADAESTPNELDQPGTLWTVALVSDKGQDVPAAWAAARRIDDGGVPTLQAFCNYEHPTWRGQGLYEAAYRQRHRAVIVPAGLPAVTYLFAGPIILHEADGWYRTGLEGRGELRPHWWWELRRDV